MKVTILFITLILCSCFVFGNATVGYDFPNSVYESTEVGYHLFTSAELASLVLHNDFKLVRQKVSVPVDASYVSGVGFNIDLNGYTSRGKGSYKGKSFTTSDVHVIGEIVTGTFNIDHVQHEFLISKKDKLVLIDGEDIKLDTCEGCELTSRYVVPVVSDITPKVKTLKEVRSFTNQKSMVTSFLNLQPCLSSEKYDWKVVNCVKAKPYGVYKGADSNDVKPVVESVDTPNDDVVNPHHKPKPCHGRHCKK